MEMFSSRRGLIFCIVTALCLGLGCHSKPVQHATLAEQISHAHDASDWRLQRALTGDIHAEFESEASFDAKFTYEISSGRVRMLLPDDTVLVFDGQTAWVSPASSPVKNARSILKTWPNFIAVPFKLGDVGVQVGPTESRTFAGQKYDTARVTLPPRQADSPDDWYIVYADPQTHRVHALAYLFTHGRKLDDPNNSPHAVTYYDFKEFGGIVIPTVWRFWQWNPSEGIYGKPIGSGRLYNLEFVTPKANAFVKPGDGRADLTIGK
jgi:hypothetical protein